MKFELKEELVFDGTNNKVIEGDFSALHKGNPFEISFDLKVDDPRSRDDMGIIATTNGESANHVGFNVSFDGKRYDSPKMYLYLIKGSPGAIIDIESEQGAYPNDSEWHTIKITYDKSLEKDANNFYVKGAGKFYVDGKLNRETDKHPVTEHSQKPHTSSLTIGSFADNTRYFKGRIKNISIKVDE